MWKRWSSWKRWIKSVIAEVRMQWCTLLRFRNLRRWCSRQASDHDRPCATLRISLNPVRSSIIQDLRLLPTLLLPIWRSPSIFLFLSLFLADKCVFQVMSINKSMSSNKKLLSIVKLVKLFVSCIQKCYPSKNFRGSALNPAGGSTPPRPPPAKHLHSPLATPLLSLSVFSSSSLRPFAFALFSLQTASLFCSHFSGCVFLCIYSAVVVHSLYTGTCMRTCWARSAPGWRRHCCQPLYKTQYHCS